MTKDCASPTTVTTTAITDFESYDGATALEDWSFNFNGDAEGVGAIYGGPYPFDDETGTPQFLMVAGNSGNYAVSVSNTEATEWGGGLGFWFTCMDATAYAGISFYVRGSTPVGTIGVSLAMEETSPPSEEDPAGGGTCEVEPCEQATAEFTITTDWTLVQLAWTDFTAGTSGTTSVPVTGANITGINLSANLEWIEDPDNADTWIPVAGAYSLEIDDLAFY